jgi:cytochrome c-type biogenesis protein CcmF
VGSPYFDKLFPMLMLPLGALVAIGIHAAWKRGQLGNNRGRILLGLGAALVIGLVLVYGVYGAGKPLTPIGMVLGIWIILSSLFDPIDRLRRRLTLPRAIIGMTLAHMGLGVGIIAISTVESYSVERDAAIAPGETLALGRYAYRFDSIKEIEGPNYDGVRAEVTVLRDGVPIAALHPEQRNYWVQRSTLTEAGIASRWNMDLFVALSKNVGGGRWSVRAQLRPLIDWVWLSAAFMALGGVFAVTDRRYRARAAASEPALAQGSAAEAS